MFAYIDTVTIDGKAQPVLCVQPQDEEQADQLTKLVSGYASTHKIDSSGHGCCHVCIYPINEAAQEAVKSLAIVPAPPAPESPPNPP